MDTLTAFANGEANRGKPEKVFDWIKAAQIIVERKPRHAKAGLESDFEYTCGTIFENGEPVITDYTYLASTWATPQIILDEDEAIDCFVMQDQAPLWNSGTKWPPEALKILKGEQEKI